MTRSRAHTGEAGGYYGRAWASQEPNEHRPFILQNLLILGMAPLVAATVYLSLGRITTALDLREHLLIRPGFVTAFYIIVDIGCFVTQVVGSVVPASGDPQGIALGMNLVIGGLIAQLVAVSLFLLSVAAAHRAANKHLWADAAAVPAVSSFEQPIMRGSSLELCKKSFSSKYFKVSYATAAVLLIRAVVRGVEHVQGEKGYLGKHEAFLYAFDALPVFLVALLYVFVHPGRLVRDAGSLKTGEEGSLSK